MKPNDLEPVECQKCGKKSEIDLSKWPPKIKKKQSIVAYKCPNGHKFIKKFDLK